MTTTGGAGVARRDDSGMAMITALLVSFVVLILALTAARVTDHVLSGVRLDRKRVFAFQDRKSVV